jgi:hypothetical protein
VSDRKWENFDEWQGIVTIEIPIAVRAMSGRPKHTDPIEQGTTIAQMLTQWCREANGDADDIQSGEASLVGNREERWAEWK